VVNRLLLESVKGRVRLDIRWHQEVRSIEEGKGEVQVSFWQAAYEQWNHRMLEQCVYQAQFGDDEQIQLAQ